MGKLLLLLVLLPLAELYLLLRLGERLGALPVLGLLLLSAALGMLLARSQGARVLRQMQGTLARGEMPAEGMLGAGLVVVGGVLLVVPGVLTDVVGLALLLPPTRRLVAAWLRRSMERRMRAGTLHVSTWGMGSSGPPRTERTLEPRKAVRGEMDAEFSEEPRD